MPEYLSYDGARVSPESKLGKELLKWERKPDYRPENNPFPRMLYRAEHRPDGRRSVGEVLDSLFAERGPDGRLNIVPGAAEQWSRRCQLTVNNEAEQQKAFEAGWRTHPQEALDHLEKRDNEVSTQTAERHYSDLRMGEVAQREAAEADTAGGLKHVPSIPEKPIKRRGRPPKNPVAA